MRSELHRFLLAITVLVGPIVGTPTSALAPGLVLVKEMILKDETGASMEPHAIAQAADNTLVVAGRIDATQQAWSLKTDYDGHVIWRHVVSIKDELPVGQGATYQGAVAMPDGSTYLCGNMPAPPGHSRSGLLTHLDAHGQIISEKIIAPHVNNGTPILLSYLNDCIAWKGRVAVVGHVIGIAPYQPAIPYYWVFTLDIHDRAQWEEVIRSGFDNVDKVGPPVVLMDQSLAFVANRLWRSELLVVHAGGDGETARRVLIDGNVILVHHAEKTPILEVFGKTEGRKFLDIEFDETLHETKRETGTSPTSIFGMAAEANPGGGDLVFGGSVNPLSGIKSAVVLVAPDLSEEAALTFNHPLDDGHIRAVAPVDSGHEFVLGRFLVGGSRPEGMALDFIRSN